MRFINDVRLDYDDVLILPKRSTLYSREQVTLEKTYTFRNSKETWTGIPIIAANMVGVGTIEMVKAFSEWKMLVALTREWRDKVNVNYKLPEGAIPTYGITSGELSTLEIQVQAWHPDFICLDVANGYQETFVKEVKRIRKCFPITTIIAGNVCTGDMTEELILAGADIVKVGIGPGSACTTRLVTGVGHPQLSAVIECADAAHGLGGHIIADGGIVHPGDLAKAFGAGADFVMMGGVLAGHDESGLKIGAGGIEFFGSSSSKAKPGANVYSASEGRVLKVPNKGPVRLTITEFLGGLRSACTYVGAKTLKELPKRTTFIRVNNTHNRSLEKHTVGK